MAKVQYTIQQVGPWPGELTEKRRGSTFAGGWEFTMRLLSNEVRHLQPEGAGEIMVVIGLAVREQDIRVDRSGLKVNAEFDHPGVMIAIPSKHGPMKYFVDRFGHWRDNVRAVARGLEAMRKVDDYGMTRRGEQYRGFKALPDPNGGLVTPPPMTVEEAANFLTRYASTVPFDIINDAMKARTAYREAATWLHPDSGKAQDAEGWNKLQDAKAVLDKHHEQRGGAR
jgi:hypothetical protein